MNESELPLGWVRATLPDLIAVDGVLKDGDWVETADQDPDGEVRLTQLADVGDGVFRDRSDRYMTTENARTLRCTFLRVDDVLIARMPDPLGRACLFPGSTRSCVTVVDVCVARPGETSASPRWLMHTINAPQFRAGVLALQSGSTRKRISTRNLCTIELQMPPRREQQRIADTIDSHVSRLDFAVAALERVERNLKRYRAAVLKAAVEGRLVPTEAELARRERRDFEPASKLLERVLTERRRRWEQAELARLTAKGKAPKDNHWKSKYAEPLAPDTSSLPPLPEGWVATTIAAIACVQGGFAFKSSDYTVSGVPLIRQSNLGAASVDLADAKFLPEQFTADFADFVVRKADVLIGMSGSVGQTSIYQHEQPALQNQRTGKFVFSTESTTVRTYFWWSLQTIESRLVAKGKGIAVQNVSSEDIETLCLALPPEAEQLRITTEVSRLLSVADEVAHTAATQLARCARLRQAILKSAFEGRLVDQDPTDEPAAALLARIRAERAAATARPRLQRRRR